MRRRLIQLDGLDRLAARDAIRAWGYPRELHEQELVAARFFSWGGDAIFWLAADADCPPRALSIHVALKPGTSLAYMGTWSEMVGWIGDLMGLDGILAKPTEPRLGRPLESLGWTPQGGGWYLPLREAEG